MSVLAAVGLCGGYGEREVISQVTLSLDAGRCLAIVGPNGAGKSTLLRLLAGILPPRAGRVELLGRPIPGRRRREVARLVGFVPQLVNVTFPMSVREFVEQGRAPHLGPWQPLGEADHAAVTRALARVDLADRAAVAIHHLSGGERQRALLARALASEPRVLLLDEPATALDVRHQLDLMTILRSLLADGVGAALVVHDLNLALRIADEVVVLSRGRVCATAPPTTILRSGVLEQVFEVAVETLIANDGTPVVVPRPPADASP